MADPTKVFLDEDDIPQAVTGDGIRHRYELCGLLEGAAAANVVLNLPTGPWEELEALLDRMKQGVLSGTSFEDHAALGTAFHETAYARLIE